MRAMVVTGPEKVEIRDVPQPSPGPGECLIELVGNTICNQHDLAVYTGRYSTTYPLENGFPGHEGVGRVTLCGPGVTEVRPGDLVAMTGIGGPPLYARFVTREAGTFFRVTPPQGYDVPSLACLELFACVEHALKKVPSFSECSVAVAGLGAAGLAALQLLRARGLRDVTGIDVDERRCHRARACGAERWLDAREFTDYTTALTCAAARYFSAGVPPADLDRAAPRKRFDIVIECTGNAASTAVSFAMARREVVMFGFCREIIPVVQQLWFDTEVTIRNSKQLENADLTTVAEHFNAGRIDPAALITHRFTDYTEAMRAVRTGSVIKAILAW